MDGALGWSQDDHRWVVKVNIRLHSLSPGALPALHTPGQMPHTLHAYTYGPWWGLVAYKLRLTHALLHRATTSFRPRKMTA
eukprot:5392994-Prymnesium_polylepis.1